jgi:hypothetical protein
MMKSKGTRVVELVPYAVCVCVLTEGGSSTKSEKRVFLAAAKERHPFLLGLHSCFQTETRVYFVME